MGRKKKGEIELVNLTPHTITVFDNNGNKILEVKPSGTVARVETETEVVGEVNGIPIVKTKFKEVGNIPEPKPDTMYIVSTLVLQAVGNDRPDLIAPDTASPESVIRDGNGRILGVRRFQRI